MKPVIFVILFGLFSSPLYCQSRQTADSLESMLQNDKERTDSSLFHLYWNLSYYHTNASKALLYADSALMTAGKVGNQLFTARANEMLGVNNRLLGNKVAALAASYKALAIYERMKLSNESAHVLLQIGEYHFEDENYPEAIKMMSKSISILDSLGAENSIAFTSINLGEAYRLNNQLDSSVIYFNKSLNLAEHLSEGQKVVSGYAKGNLGLALSQLTKYDSALYHLNDAIEILSELGDYTSICIYMAEKGNILIKKEMESSGLAILLKALNIAETQKLKKPIRDISKQLVEYYESVGNYKEAYTYQHLFQVYQDSLVNAENIREAEQIKSNYMLDKKELEIENLSIQNELKEAKIQQIIMAVILIGLLFIILLVAYRNKQKSNTLLSQKNQIITKQIKEKELLHREIHHRVKNNLQLVSSIMGLQSQSSGSSLVADAMSVGKSRVDAMTIIHQSLFSQGDEPSVDIKDYLSKLVENLSATYQEQLTEINTDVTPLVVDADMAIPIGLIVNEAICNAVKYHSVSDLKIELVLKESNNEYTLVIADNGGGLDQDNANEGTGFGTRLIKTLARQLNANCIFESNGLGVSVILTFNKPT